MAMRAFVLAAALLAGACTPPTVYRPAPEGSYTKLVSSLQIETGTILVPTAFVTQEFFPATRGAPLLGRLFMDGDRSSSTPVIVLSHRLWQRTFGGDRAIIGRAVRFDNRSAVIVGVMPERFEIPAGVDAWAPR